jgi:hypothetical protein
VAERGFLHQTVAERIFYDRLRRLDRFRRGKPSANPQGILLVVVLVIVIETSQVEHEDENDDEDGPQSRSAESIPAGQILRRA